MKKIVLGLVVLSSLVFAWEGTFDCSVTTYYNGKFNFTITLENTTDHYKAEDAAKKMLIDKGYSVKWLSCNSR